jgi:hypothetical protein
MQISSAVVVIAGGSRGLGYSIAKECISRGARVIISSHEVEKLLTAARKIGATPMVCDVTDEVQVASLANDVMAKFGRIDAWVNNAGVWVPHAAADAMNMAKVRDMFAVNTFGLMYGSRAAMHWMKKKGAGLIVNVLSSSALEAHAMSSGYGASKWAGRGFTLCIREELRGSGVGVIGVYPAPMQTDLFGPHAPEQFPSYLDPMFVAGRIVDNWLLENPVEEQVIRREGA